MYIKSKTAQEAFENLYDYIMSNGEDSSNGTKQIFNTHIEIENPKDNIISTVWRKWNLDYANYEWDWYLSGNANAEEISISIE